MTEQSESLVVLPESSELLFGIGMAMILVGLLVAAVFVIRDMNRRGQPGLLWGLIVFFAPFIGLLLWAGLRKTWPRFDAPGAGDTRPLTG